MNKETAQGAITDLDGKFSLETSIPSTIDISYVGYEVATVHVKDGQTKTIRLVPSSLMIDEVVVVGYGSQRRSNLTGAVSTISSKELNNRPVVSAANALQGADPSVNLTFGTGSPESGYSLNIRGGISVNGGTPLVLCDGVEVPLNQVNANDIESISVLKDASSCAIMEQRPLQVWYLSPPNREVLQQKEKPKSATTVDLDGHRTRLPLILSVPDTIMSLSPTSSTMHTMA